MDKPKETGWFKKWLKKFEEKYFAPTITAIVGGIYLLYLSDPDKPIFKSISTGLQNARKYISNLYYTNISITFGGVLQVVLLLICFIIASKYLPKRILVGFFKKVVGVLNLLYKIDSVHALFLSNEKALEKVSQDLAQTQEDMKGLSAALADVDDENKKLVAMLKEKVEEYIKLKEEYASVVAELIKTKEEAQEQIKQLELQLEQVETELSQTKELQFTTKGELQILERVNQITNSRLEEAYQRIKVMTDQLTFKTDELSIANNAISTLTGHLAMTEEQRRDFSERYSAVCTKIDQIRIEFEQTKKDYADTLVALEEKDKLLQETKKEFEEKLSKAKQGQTLGKILYQQQNLKIKDLTELFNHTQTQLLQAKTKLADTQFDLDLTTRLQEETKIQLEEANSRISTLTEVKEPEKPPYFNYTRDVFFNWIWEWVWEFDVVSEKWHIKDLQPHCPTCDIELIDCGINEPFELARCPKCKKYFGDHIDGLVIDNGDTEEVRSIRILINNKVKKGTYDLQQKSQ